MGAYKLRRAAGVQAARLEQAAAKSWEIEPGVDEPARPIYLNDAHVGRILGSAPPVQPIGEIIAEVRAERHLALPTRAFLLRDAVLFRHEVYCGMFKGDLFSALGMRAVDSRMAHASHVAALATTYAGSKWFGHFLHDDLPLQMLAARLGDPVSHLRRIYHHEPVWRSKLGLPAPSSYSMLHAKELIWLDDRGQNIGKCARYGQLRQRLKGHSPGSDRVFLRRAQAPGDDRTITNIDEVEARLAREGFDLVDTAHASAEEIMRRCFGASVVVSVEGSHAAPAYYLARDGACLFFIYPPSRVSAIMPRLAGFFGLAGAMFIGRPTTKNGHGFPVDPDELVREIDSGVAFAKKRPSYGL